MGDARYEHTTRPRFDNRQLDEADTAVMRCCLAKFVQEGSAPGRQHLLWTKRQAAPQHIGGALHHAFTKCELTPNAID